jgi:hypothetical protein
MRFAEVRPWFLAVLAATCVSCAPGPNPERGTPNAVGQVAGFWDGVWHGVIAPVTFVWSLFDDRVQVYEVHNRGGWYNFGFLLGLSIMSGGGAGKAASSRGRRQR